MTCLTSGRKIGTLLHLGDKSHNEQIVIQSGTVNTYVRYEKINQCGTVNVNLSLTKWLAPILKLKARRVRRSHKVATKRKIRIDGQCFDTLAACILTHTCDKPAY